MMRRWLSGRAAKPVLFVAGLMPLAWLLWGALAQNLGPNPAEALIRSTGDWTLRMLCIVLAVTPLRVMTGTPALARLRRMVGLVRVLLRPAALCCATLAGHGVRSLSTSCATSSKRPFILVGFLALLLLTALAATSFNRAIRWLGARRWQMLHRAVYAVAMLAVLHFFWMRAGKNDFAEVSVYGAILATCLGWRIVACLAPQAPDVHAPPVPRLITPVRSSTEQPAPPQLVAQLVGNRLPRPGSAVTGHP